MNPLVHWFTTGLLVDLRINETRQTDEVRKPTLPLDRLVGAVFNSAYSVRLETAPTPINRDRDRGAKVSAYFSNPPIIL